MLNQLWLLFSIVVWLKKQPLYRNFKYVLFRTAQSKLTTKNQALVLRQNKIEQVECIKFRGVYIQEHLSWSRHINHLIPKLRSVLRSVIKVKSLLNKRSLFFHFLINTLYSKEMF